MFKGQRKPSYMVKNFNDKRGSTETKKNVKVEVENDERLERKTHQVCITWLMLEIEEIWNVLDK